MSDGERTGRISLDGISPRIDIALAIPVRDGRLLVARRPEGARLAGCWEFPGGKVERGEEPAAAARRELEEETGLRAGELEPLVIVVHDYREMPLRFHVFITRDTEGEVRMTADREWAWKSLTELQRLEIPEANRQMLRALSWRLR
jgi:8-oxo-dGTP diphosphatase